jgi:Protein of unknown function (DUF4230)
MPPYPSYMEGMNRILFPIVLLSALLAGFFWFALRNVDPPVETIVASSLQSLQEQNRLSVFAARFVTVVTSRKQQFGLSAEKTLILPAMVRYDVDLARLAQKDLRWDERTATLSVTLPPIALTGPEFAMDQAREYGDGTVLMTLTDVERVLDKSNSIKARADVLKQAQAAPIMALARDAATRAIERSFAMPLRAAGIEAKVVVTIQ